MPPSLLPSILTSLPTTLRVFAIRIWMSSGVSWRQHCAEALDFDDADDLLCPASRRFPLLQRVDLKVCFNYWASTTLLQGAESDAYHPPILPRVQAAGIFRFRAESGYGWPPKRERFTFIGFGI